VKFTLEQTIEVFTMIPDVQEFATPEGATGHCNDAALAFCTLLRASDFDCVQQQLFHPQLTPPPGCHVVAGICDLYIDWTARQYDANSAFPRIMTRQQWEEEGWIFGNCLSA
jgi:hypothetical protein